MLSVEQEPIRLPPILSEVEGPEGRLVRMSKNLEILVPRKFGFLWDQVKVGASIYDLSLRLRHRGEGSRIFLEVASFLCFLVDYDLIDDLRLVRLADSIRGEYEWPEDIVASVSFSNTIYSWSRRAQQRIPTYSRSFDFISALFVLLSLPFTVLLVGLLFDPAEIHVTAFGLFFLVGIFIAGTIGRTGAAVFRSFASNIAGDAGELSWVIDLFGPHLRFAPHTVTGAFRRAADFVVCFGTAAVPLALTLLVKNSLPGIAPSLWALTLVGSLFFVALETHPSTKSQLTKSLRVWNRTPLVWREEDELQEVEAFHRIGGVLSMATAAAFFGIVILAIVKTHPDANFFRLHFTSSVMFALTFIFTVFAYVEPFFRHDLPRAAKRNRRRRLWATRTKILSVAAADREAWNELPVLRQLTAPIRRKLVGAARVVEYRPGTSVCKQGDTDRSLYIVLQGKLAVAKSFEGRRRKVVAILTEGAVFGETAFFFGTQRTADVVAMDECHMLEIPYMSMMKDLDLNASEDFQFRVWLLQALSGNAMLKELPSEAMDTLIFAGTRKSFRAGEAIFTEGSPATTCYFIAQGRASVVQGGRKISELGAGDAFGEIALLRTGSRRTASVVADSDLLCMELEIDSFWALLAARLPLGAEIERLALRRLRSDENRKANE